MKLLMITGLGSAKDLASGKKGAFYNTLEEFHKYWERIDIMAPKILNPKSEILNKSKVKNPKSQTIILFGNVYIHISPWPLVFHPFWFLKKGIEIYKEQKFDLMTVHEFPPFYNGIGARLLWQKIKVPYVLEIHHIPGYPKRASFKESVYYNLMRWFIRFDSSRAIAVRVVNQIQVPEFIIQAGVSREKIVYIPSVYIDLDIFKPMNLIKEYDMIFVGRLEKNKGIHLLLKAIEFSISNFSRLYRGSSTKSGQFPIKCLIVGDGPLAESLKFKVKSLKLENQMIFHGWAKDSWKVAELINKSRILVMPSYNEGGPRVVLEAMACGVPVLATNVGLMPDFADKNAVKIIDWDSEDFAIKAKKLLENEDERDRLSQVGLEIARKFEKKEMIKNYAEKLKQLV